VERTERKERKERKESIALFCPPLCCAAAAVMATKSGDSAIARGENGATKSGKDAAAPQQPKQSIPPAWAAALKSFKLSLASDGASEFVRRMSWPDFNENRLDFNLMDSCHVSADDVHVLEQLWVQLRRQKELATPIMVVPLYADQCVVKTKRGLRCRRRSQKTKNHCWQHAHLAPEA